MAILHQATLVPSKLELMTSWLPGQSWLGNADTSEINAVGAFRFDDPDDEVGIETLLLKSADGQTIQVPLTYRAAPLTNAESFLIGTTMHSALGKRWVYDGCGDVVYLTALAATILHGGREAALDVVTDHGLVRREATTMVSGSGTQQTDVHILEPLRYENRATQTHVIAADIELVISRVIENDVVDGYPNTLRGTWVGRTSPASLAYLFAA